MSHVDVWRDHPRHSEQQDKAVRRGCRHAQGASHGGRPGMWSRWAEQASGCLPLTRTPGAVWRAAQRDKESAGHQVVPAKPHLGDKEGWSQRGNWVSSEHIYSHFMIKSQTQKSAETWQQTLCPQHSSPHSPDSTCSLTPTRLDPSIDSPYFSFAEIQSKYTHPKLDIFLRRSQQHVCQMRGGAWRGKEEASPAPHSCIVSVSVSSARGRGTPSREGRTHKQGLDMSRAGPTPHESRALGSAT